MFAGRSGGTTTCEHSWELTPGLLELKATGVCPCYLRLFSHLRATPVVVGPLDMVSPNDRFLSHVPNGQGSYERGSRSTLVYRLSSAVTFFQLKYIVNLGTWTQQCPS